MTVTIEDIHRHEGAEKTRASYGKIPSTEIPPLFDEPQSPEVAVQKVPELARPLGEKALAPTDPQPELALWPETIEQAAELEPLVGTRADHWFVEKFGERWWHALGFAERKDATPSKLTDVFLAHITISSSTNSPERMRTIIDTWLSGRSTKELAEVRPELGNAGAISAMLSLARNRFSDAVSEGLRNKRPVSARWAEQLGFNEQDTKSLRVYLNVTGGTIMGRDESRVAGKFKQHIIDGLGTVDNELIGLSEVQRRIMRDILGAMPTDEGVTPEQRRMQPVGRFLHHYNRRDYEFRDPKAMIVELRTALEALLAADRKRPAPVRQVTAPDSDAPVIY